MIGCIREVEKQSALGKHPVHALHSCFFCAREAERGGIIALTRSKYNICTVGDYWADLEQVYLLSRCCDKGGTHR